jgi:hypothetical protein
MWEAAKVLNRDPLAALGVHGALTIEHATFALAMHNPKVTQEQAEMREAIAAQTTMSNEDAWDAALPGGTGYRGARTSGVKHGE